MTLRKISNIDEIRNYCKNKDNIIFIPTMGALHAGHISLVEQASIYGDNIILSVFVNPTQFGKNEDFDKYPRTINDDIEKLKNTSCKIIFTPEINEIYHNSFYTKISLPKMANKLCGLTRPGHFDGVCLIVLKLLSIINPAYAVFGIKDFQQVKIIKKMLFELNIDTKIIEAEIKRDQNGLALSSRNIYLNDKEKAVAPLIYSSLAKAKNIMREEKNWQKAKSFITENLINNGFQIEYIECVNEELDFIPQNESNIDLSDYSILIATFLGTTRLIDNISLAG